MVDQIKVPTKKQIEDLGKVDEVVHKVLGLHETFPHLTETDLLRLMTVHHVSIIHMLRRDTKTLVENLQKESESYQPAKFTGFTKPI